MSRDEGFPHADIDTAILDDAKVRALVRATRDESIVARCVAAYLATVTTSWARGERVTVDDAAPLWLTALDDLRERLVAVELLDSEGRIPDHAWESWFRPAWERREAKRAGGKLGGQRSWEARSKVRFGIAPAEPNPSSTPSSNPSRPPAPTTRKREEGLRQGNDGDGFSEEWRPFLNEWDRRFGLPPKGKEDERGSQRSLLWEVVSGNPKRAAEWLADAPADLDSFHAVDHVRKAWMRAVA